MYLRENQLLLMKKLNENKNNLTTQYNDNYNDKIIIADINKFNWNINKDIILKRIMTTKIKYNNLFKMFW